MIRQDNRVYKWLDRISYKPEVKFSVECLTEIFMIKAVRHTLDSRNGESKTKIGSILSIHYKELEDMSFDCFVERLFLWILSLEDHEAKEWFKVDRISIYDPHKEDSTQ